MSGLDHPLSHARKTAAQVIDDLVEELAAILRRQGKSLSAMESCTGGMLASVLTSVPGCGDFFRGAIVAYASDVKVDFGVDPHTLETHGVVSSVTARAMARAARLGVHADIGIGITGVAGPDPQDGVPVGRVHIALDEDQRSGDVRTHDFEGNLEQIKQQAVAAALQFLRASLEEREL